MDQVSGVCHCCVERGVCMKCKETRKGKVNICEQCIHLICEACGPPKKGAKKGASKVFTCPMCIGGGPAPSYADLVPARATTKRTDKVSHHVQEAPLTKKKK